MPFLPIAERELRVAARRKATYRTRFWAVFTGVGHFHLAVSRTCERRIAGGDAGKNNFHRCFPPWRSFTAVDRCRATADCLSEEKREGTLGLLFLTDLKGYDIVFGKLVSRSLNAVYGLLAIFPVIGICLLLGGVSMAQFAKTVLSLLTALFFSLAAGLFVSTFNRQERVAMFFTIVLFFFFAGGPFLAVDQQTVAGLASEPGVYFILAIEPFAGFTGMFDPNAYWYGLIVTWVTTVAFLAYASLRLPHSWQEQERKPFALGRGTRRRNSGR